MADRLLDAIFEKREVVTRQITDRVPRPVDNAHVDGLEFLMGMQAPVAHAGTVAMPTDSAEGREDVEPRLSLRS
jgi:hypothetical protein